jgi:ribosomal-protein-alanine N-acetyltransferase
MSADAVRVRQMVADDLERVIEIANGLAEAPHWEIAAYQSALDPDALVRRIALVAAEPSQRRVVGFLVAKGLIPESELETVAVAADAQGAGVGGLLIEAMFEELLKEQVAEVHLEVRNSNERAQRLYRRYGFGETGRRPGYYSDPVEDAVLMTRYLQPENCQ